jgi:hypothetical protein
MRSRVARGKAEKIMLKRSNNVAAGGPIGESDQIRMIKLGAGAARPRKSGPFRDQNEKDIPT